jgi:hypothetical protein
MDRRQFLGRGVLGLIGVAGLAQCGCRSRQTATVVKPGQSDMVGSHAAGAETYGPLVDTAVGNLLARHNSAVHPVGLTEGAAAPGQMRICFIGVENKSSEEIGDFKEQLYQQIDTRIVQSQVYQLISRRFVDAGLQECRLRPDQLFIPSNMQTFTRSLEQMGQIFDYLLYATITSGTTRSNADYQRNYLLTLEMVNTHNGQYDKESAEITKIYNVSAMAKIKAAMQ